MNVLSLFDGISCGQVALRRTGIEYSKYYASEIDTRAIQVTQKHFPNTIQLGDIQSIIIPENINLVMGGSPCQGFSNVGMRRGFDDPRSALLYNFVDIVKSVKPKYFLLENVSMKKEWLDIITNLIGVEPICINSSHFSAQLRKRYYWTNIPQLPLPEPTTLVLQDIVESGIVDRDKSYCVDAHYSFGTTMKRHVKKTNHMRTLVFEPPTKDKSYTVYNKFVYIEEDDGSYNQYFINLPDGRYTTRKLTPVECERLQTLPDNYTEGHPKTHRYKMLGNGWTVDVIAHILSGIHGDKE